MRAAAAISFVLLILAAIAPSNGQTPTIAPTATLRYRIWCVEAAVVGRCSYWQHTTGPQGAIIEALAVHPNGTIFAGTQRGGLFLSRDNGTSWGFAGFGNTYLVSAIAFASAGDVFVAVDRAVYRSTDNGATWNPTAPVGSGYYVPYVNALAISASGTLYAGTDVGVVQSSDNGETWTPIAGLAGEVVDIAIKGNGNLIVALQDWSDDHGKVYRSIDNGATWSATALPTIWRIGSLAIGPTGDLLVGTYLDGFLRSIDDGATWTSSSLGSNYVYSILETATAIFATAEAGVYRSTDGAVTWSAVLPAGGHSLAMAPSGEVFATQGWDIYRSMNGGASWSRTSTSPIGTWVNALAFNSSWGNLLAGTTGGGVFRTTDAGDTWTQTSSGLGAATVLSLAVNSQGYVFAGLDYNRGVYRSTDGGATWVEKNSGLVWRYEIPALAIDENDHIFAATNNGVYRSVDAGNNWTRLTRFDNGFVSPDTGSQDITILSVAVKPGGYVFAGTYIGLYRSTDGGDHWTYMSPGAMCPGEEYVEVTKLVVAPDGKLYAGTFDCGVVRSSDNGATWTPLLAQVAEAIGVSPTGEIFISRRWGFIHGEVYYSSNSGATWKEMEGGLLNTSVLSFAFGRGGRPFAGTYGAGVHRKFIPTVTSPLQKPAIQFAAQQFFDDFFRNFFFCLPSNIPGAPPCPNPADPQCPKCAPISGLGPGDGPRGDVLRQLTRIIAQLTTASSSSQRRRGMQNLARAARAAPLGPNYSLARRDSLIALSRRTELGVAERRTILAAMNALDLDARLPKTTARRVEEGIRRVDFGNGTSVIAPIAAAGMLRLEISDAYPNRLPAGYKPLWPLGTYSLRFSGRLSADGTAEVSFSLRGVGAKPGADVRVLEFDASGFRDITSIVDWVTGRITASPTRLGSYVVMERVGAVTPDQK